ncbi:hypothetical protein K505DRAFT_370153 [Melanomma pulvis-pyrius CBS 109.77]|uniref:Uncharacterized protein n=1 Tax=Melanomma pulvis-pyrius CBS 109.77 TaxID=1314802 RepID=A0A6A6XWG1_9PLEO|nr:hypothetical protein K505DRAFT_370153 [Melanomma pulvis-pyrius CBS 109.77]
MANTLVGPITTVFTPPASCLQVITLGADQDYFQESSSLFIGNFNGQYRDKNYLSAAKDCYPTPTSAIDYWANYYYSPAYCPTGYLPACSYTAGDPPLATHVTASLCCASGYVCVDGWAHGCQRLTSGVLTNIFAASGPAATLGASDPLSTMTLEEAQYIWNDGIPVAWEPTDTGILALAAQRTVAKEHRQSTTRLTSPSTPSTPTNTSPGAPPAATETPSSAAGEPTPPLSTGTKIGIAVAALSLAIILVCAGLFFFSFFRRRHGNVAVSREKIRVPAEGHAVCRSELEAPPPELVGDTLRVAEMPDPYKNAWGGRQVVHQGAKLGT